MNIKPLYLKAGISLIAVLIITVGAYSIGFRNGTKNIMADWNQAKLDQRTEIDKIQSQYSQREDIYRIEIKNLNDTLESAGKRYEEGLAAINANNTLRLLQSEDRARIYQHQAETGAVECRGLESHATRLDRYLTEGIGLVEELTAVIKQRDSQLIGLGQQIRSDRKLLGDEDGK